MAENFTQSGISINLSQYVSHIDNGKPVVSCSITAVVMTAGGHSVVNPSHDTQALLAYMISEGVLKIMCDRTPNQTLENLARRFVTDVQDAVNRHGKNSLQEVANNGNKNTH